MHFVVLMIILIAFNNFGANQAFDIPVHLRAQAIKLHNLCKKATGVSEEIIQQSTKGKLADDRNMQCYLHCLFDKVGLVDDNHDVHLEYMMEVLPPETHGSLQRFIDKCGTKHGADGCETVYLTMKCYFETDPEALANKFTFLFD